MTAIESAGTELELDQRLAPAILSKWTLLDLMKIAAQRSPRIARLEIGGEDVYLLTHAETVRQALIRSQTSTEELDHPELNVLFDNSLAGAMGSPHVLRRRSLNPYFTPKASQSSSDVITEVVLERTNGWASGDTIDIRREMNEIFTIAFGRAVLGIDLSGQVDGLLKTFGSSGLAAFNNGERSDLLEQIITSVIEAAEASEEDDRFGPRLLQLWRSGEVSESECRATIQGLLLGSMTGGTMLTWAWALLGNDQTVSDAVAAEASTTSDPANMTLGTIAEALRLYPPTWVIKRRTGADLTVDGYLIPAGSSLWASSYAIQRDPRFWNEPDAFRPTRWIDSDSQFSLKTPGTPPGAWFPFGLGRRTCIGEDFAWAAAEAIISTISSRWRLRLVSPGPVAYDVGTLLRPKGGKLFMEVSHA